MTPDELDKTPIDLIDQYNSKVIEGKEKWKDKKIVISGLCRNCETQLPRNIKLMEELGLNSKDYKIVIYENNSTDLTKDILKKAQKNNLNIILLGEDDNTSQDNGYSDSRIIKMVKYRTIVQDYIKNNFSDYDYVVLIDLDMRGGWSNDGLMTSLAWFDFDVMGSISQQFYPSLQSENGWVHYDRWAFKFHTWQEEWSSIQDMSMRWFWYWKPPRGAEPIKCLSVFGGLAIYKMNAYLSGVYGNKHPNEIGGLNTVEHSQFHYSLYSNGYQKIFLNPSQRCIT